MINMYVSPAGSDANNGSKSAPFRSLLAASQAAQPGTTVHVAPGIYDGGFITRASGSAAAPINYVSDVKWGAKIVPAANSTYDIAWDNRGAYVTIDGFDVDGSATQAGVPWRVGLYTAGSNSSIEDSEVHNIGAANMDTSKGGAGIEGDSYFGGTNINLSNNLVYGIGPALGANNTVHGIYMETSGTVMDNVVSNASGWGISLWHDANHVDVANNTVFHNGSGGITVGGGDFYQTPGLDDYTTVENNISYDNGKYGIYEYGATGAHNVYSHNLVYKNGTNWVLQNGLTATNTITAAPDFVNYVATGGGDYHLAAGSPAIGAGMALNAPTSDFDGNIHPADQAYDIGAYDFQASPPSGAGAVPAPAAQSTVTIAATDANPVVNVSHAAVMATTGDHSLFLGGSFDAVVLTGGTETVDAQQGGNSITTGAGSDTIALGGSGNTVDAGGGRNKVTDSGSGNTFVIPGAGKGFDNIFGNVLRHGDTLDFRSALQGTAWDGSQATIGEFLHVRMSGRNAVVSISTTSGGARTNVANMHGVGYQTLTSVLTHAMT